MVYKSLSVKSIGEQKGIKIIFLKKKLDFFKINYGNYLEI
ncbi:MAG: hypothetical protein CM15mV29_0490 [uncultured marine virus]|nr:MAG: hypothetical protein CM15mV29_0490 [uncultured marine virus]